MLSAEKNYPNGNRSPGSKSFSSNTGIGEIGDLDVSIGAKENARQSSPSPKGIETFGACSPFSLPDPTAQFTFVEPDELCRILDGTDVSRPMKDESMLDYENYMLPKSELSDFDLFCKVRDIPAALVTSEAPWAEKEGTDIAGNEPLAQDLNRSMYMAEPLAVLKSSTFPMGGDGQVAAIIEVSNEFAEEGAGIEKDRVPEVYKRCEIEERNSTETRSGDRVRSPKSASANSVNQNLAENVSKSYHDLPSPKLQEKGSAHDKQSRTNRKGRSENITEEELKRIRRVKNRASVEKCRTKQRLRMEALQSEMETLTSENKTLRDLTNWMDCSVGDIALQVRNLSCDRNGDR